MAAVILAVGLGQAASSQACAAVLPAAGAGAQTATHYVLQGLPNCSYPSPPADGLFAALPPAEYSSAAACGEYVRVNGPDGSVLVKVVDQCPDCAAGHVDLSEAAFARLAPLAAGLVSVSYAPVANPPLPGPVSVAVKQGSSQYWLALLADNTGNPLSSVQVETASGWLPLARASYNYWIAQSGAGPGPFTVRLTDTQGHQATVTGITLSPGVAQPTSTWMYGAGGAPGPAASGPAAAPATAPAGRQPCRGPAGRYRRDSLRRTPGRGARHSADPGRARSRRAAAAGTDAGGALGSLQLLSAPPPEAAPCAPARPTGPRTRATEVSLTGTAACRYG